MKEILNRILLVVAIIYLSAVAYMYFNQRSLQYAPDAISIGTPAEAGVPSMQVVTTKTDDGLELVNWYAPPASENGKIIVFFHGNAGSIKGRAYKAADFIAKGYGFMLVEYRGYGGNKGFPTEEGFYKDARAALKWLEEQGHQPSQLIFYGESIGTGVAVEMAVEKQPAQVILEAPFTSAADVARSRYGWLPVDLLMKDRFDSIKKITTIKSPLLILHGDNDLVVPFNEGKLLYEKANEPKLFSEFTGGGHSDLYHYGAAQRIFDWLDLQVVKTAPESNDSDVAN